MTIDEMETLLRQYLENPSTGSFSQAEAFRLINKSYENLYNLIVRNNQNFFAASYNISLVANQEEYTLTAANRILLVERVDVNEPYPLPFIDYRDRTRYLLNSGEAPDEYDLKCYIKGNILGIVPIPTGAAANAIKVSHVPPATQLTTGESPPTEWPTDQHEVIVIGGLLRKGITDREDRKARKELYAELRESLLESTGMRQTQQPAFFGADVERIKEW